MPQPEMSARMLDGRALAARVRGDVAERAAAFGHVAGRRPSLAAVLVGDDPASVWYAQMKARAAEKVGLGFHCIAVAEGAGTDHVLEVIRDLNDDDAVDGVMVEMPLPAGYDGGRIREAVQPDKDVEGGTWTSLGKLLSGASGPVPATAVAIALLLHDADVTLAGKRATVVGRSLVVGKPTALLLLAADATVTVAHSRTADLPAATKSADVLVAAAGVPGLITARHVKPGATVIDAGTTAVGEGDSSKIVGDVAFDEVAAIAGAITPVPGGVGPVTTAVLLSTAVELAERRRG